MTTLKRLSTLLALCMLCTVAAAPMNLLAQAAGNALKFDGFNDFVDLPDGLVSSLTSFTFEAWVYWEGPSNSNWQRIFDFGSNTDVNMFLTPRSFRDGVTVRFAITTSGALNEQQLNAASGALPVNSWHHIAVTIDGINEIGKLYIDGILQDQKPITLSPSDLGSTSNNWLGKSQYIADPYFKGRMDEVRIWSVARTQDEIQSNLCQTLSGTEPGLVAYYRFDEASGQIVEDQTPNNHDGTLGATSTQAFDDPARVISDISNSVCSGLVPVELTSFAASTTADGVLLTWSTGSETENLGFHIYRSNEAEGDYTRINKSLIPGAGNSAKAHTYQFLDTSVQTGNTYFYKLADVDFNGTLTFHGPISVTVETLPTQYALEQNFPNPFNPATTIRFQLPEAGNVHLAIYNTAGQQVRTLVDGEMAAGSHSVLWDGTDDLGARVASGVYLAVLRAGSFTDQKKLVLAK